MGMLLRRHYNEEQPDLSEMTIKQLNEKGVEGYSALDKEALIEARNE
ncbi:hypothetical protein [Parasutterella excrementihominis]|nr:hypothetical protein [Parasutterella excrementihominis]